MFLFNEKFLNIFWKVLFLIRCVLMNTFFCQGNFRVWRCNMQLNTVLITMKGEDSSRVTIFSINTILKYFLVRYFFQVTSL